MIFNSLGQGQITTTAGPSTMVAILAPQWHKITIIMSIICHCRCSDLHLKIYEWFDLVTVDIIIYIVQFLKDVFVCIYSMDAVQILCPGVHFGINSWNFAHGLLKIYFVIFFRKETKILSINIFIFRGLHNSYKKLIEWFPRIEYNRKIERKQWIITKHMPDVIHYDFI